MDKEIKIAETIGWIFAILFFIGFVVILLIPEDKINKQNNAPIITQSEEDRNKYIEEQKTFAVNNLIQIKKDYDNNELTAADKYKSKEFPIYCKINSITETGIVNNIFKELTVIGELEDKNSNSILFIKMCFPKEQRQELSNYKTGDWILVRGTCYSWGYWSNCKIVK